MTLQLLKQEKDFLRLFGLMSFPTTFLSLTRSSTPNISLVPKNAFHFFLQFKDDLLCLFDALDTYHRRSID